LHACALWQHMTWCFITVAIVVTCTVVARHTTPPTGQHTFVCDTLVTMGPLVERPTKAVQQQTTCSTAVAGLWQGVLVPSLHVLVWPLCCVF
jgi:hypothetical protein